MCAYLRTAKAVRFFLWSTWLGHILWSICLEQNLWRGSLLPLGCEATPKASAAQYQPDRISSLATASQPSGSKLPRHKNTRHSQLSIE